MVNLTLKVGPTPERGLLTVLVWIERRFRPCGGPREPTLEGWTVKLNLGYLPAVAREPHFFDSLLAIARVKSTRRGTG